jgi:hypothetical protein
MAYMGTEQNLGGLFDWMGKIATPAAIALAPIPLPLKAALGIRALSPTQPTHPPMNGPTDPLPVAQQPLKALAPPQAGVQPAKTQVVGISSLVGSALRMLNSAEQPLAPDAGSVKKVASAPAPTATQMAKAPSGTPASSPPIDAETRAAVNGAAPTVIPIAPQMPGWVLPVAAVLGVWALTKVMR